MSEPVIILGIMPRCGTNFLSDLLTTHPDLALPAPVWEDFLVHYSSHLRAFTESVFSRWSPSWGMMERHRQDLERSLGHALVAFLQAQAGGRRVVTKTPSVAGLENVFTYFPDARVLVLVRDGRAVVESGVKTFHWDYEPAMRRWAEAARTILAFGRSRAAPERYRVLRYEALASDPVGSMRGLVEFLGLDPTRWDESAVRSLPVRGSSDLAGVTGAVHWKPVEKERGFDPLSRFASWSQARHERFNWIAGAEQRGLGYDLQEATSGRWRWRIWNHLQDKRMAATHLNERVQRRFHRAVGRR